MKLNKISINPIQILLIVAILFIVVNQYLEQKDIVLHKRETSGKVIKFISGNKTYYSIKYEYFVHGIRYVNEVGVSYFKCFDGKKGCVGSEFTVYYSSKNPEHSRIDLGKYEKYKKTVEFVK